MCLHVFGFCLAKQTYDLFQLKDQFKPVFWNYQSRELIQI